MFGFRFLFIGSCRRLLFKLLLSAYAIDAGVESIGIFRQSHTALLVKLVANLLILRPCLFDSRQIKQTSVQKLQFTLWETAQILSENCSKLLMNGDMFILGGGCDSPQVVGGFYDPLLTVSAEIHITRELIIKEKTAGNFQSLRICSVLFVGI